MNVGFYILDIKQDNPNAIALLNVINDVCKLRPQDNIVVFSNTPDAIISGNKYYMLHVSQAKFFKGVLFLFDHKSRLLTQTFLTPKKQVMFMMDTPWGKENTTQELYSNWKTQYGSDNLEFVATNQEVYDLLDICYKEPVSLMSEVSPEEINNVIEKV
jgi:hypothetical protein